MNVADEHDSVAGILRSMVVDVDVCGALVEAARDRSPELARLAEAETRSHVTAMIHAADTWFDTFERVEEQDFTAALLLGADRAGQGIPMTAVLQGLQAAFTRTTEIMVDRCRSDGVSDGALLTMVMRLKEYGDAVERHVINGYRAAERGTAHEPLGAPTRILRQLLVGGVTPSAEELVRAGIRPGGQHHCLVRDMGDSARTRPPMSRLAVPRGTFGLVEGRLVGLCPRTPTREEIEATALVVVSPAAPLNELRPLYRLCVRAVDIGRRQGRRGLYDLTDFAAEIALADQPLLGSVLSARFLNGLDQSDAFHRQLALTALTFLDNGRRLDQTATVLFTHPNTVRYRLGRLQQITGESLTDAPAESRSGPLSTLHWWWALTTWLRPAGDSPGR
ncbi:PucR family transcriptional regulator [Streptomyces sp. NPDC005808]|uniref:PucR family transcriptional regulator n=1 Tax=Streptomyces sp. NPDC005808 TaxID=3364734 RepID=UPI0036812309